MGNFNGSVRAASLSLLLLILMGVTFSGSRNGVLAQAGSTATPDADGVIYSVVAPNDSLWSIASRAGLGLQELLSLNDLSEDAIIQPGQWLIIGYGPPPATATVELPTPTATATRLPPTATATPMPPPRTAICLLAFTDNNGNGVYDAGEPSKDSVAFTVYNQDAVVKNYITDGVSEPYCVESLPPGDYKVTRSIGRDEKLTTAGDWTLTLVSGSVLHLEFGSLPPSAGVGAAGNETPVGTGNVQGEEVGDSQPEIGPASGQRFGILAGFVIVLVLLLAGLFAAFRFRQRQPGK